METTYRVVYTVNAEKYSKEAAVATVVIREGYSDFEDIRGMIAISRGVQKDQIKVHIIKECE